MEIEPPVKQRYDQKLYMKGYITGYMRKYNLEKINCECGSIVSKSKIYQHRNTKKHLKFLKEK